MIYVPLTIKSISIIGTSVRHQLATLSARPLSLFFFIAMHCISIGIYIPLLHIADMDGLTHFLCLDNWAHFVCVLFYFRISFILCDFLSAQKCNISCQELQSREKTESNIFYSLAQNGKYYNTWIYSTTPLRSYGLQSSRTFDLLLQMIVDLKRYSDLR